MFENLKNKTDSWTKTRKLNGNAIGKLNLNTGQVQDNNYKF